MKRPTRLTRKQLRISLIALAGVVALSAALYVWGQPLLSLFTNQEQLKQSIDSAGVFGPLVYILLQATQVLIAPIPGQVTGLASGYLFGPHLGVLYSMIGAAIGFTIIFVITRRYGRPLVERFFNKKHIEKFDYITKNNGTLTLFLIFLLPAFPDDLICFLAGLTTIPIRTLIVISILGRLPGYYLLALTGSDLSQGGISPGVLTAGVVALFVILVAYLQKEWLNDFVKSQDHAAFIKRRWGLSRTATILWTGGIIVGAVLTYVIASTVLA